MTFIPLAPFVCQNALPDEWGQRNKDQVDGYMPALSASRCRAKCSAKTSV